jgi:hypothetical protein
MSYEIFDHQWYTMSLVARADKILSMIVLNKSENSACYFVLVNNK